MPSSSSFAPLYMSVDYAFMQSRASATVLNTILRMTLFSYGNIRISGTCPTAAAQPFLMIFSRLITLARLLGMPKIVRIGSLGAAPQMGEI